MAHRMWLRVKITEKATGRVITYSDHDDEYYPFEVGAEKLSSVGYAEVCCFDGEDVCSKIRAALEESSDGADFGRDVPLSPEQLRGICAALPQYDELCGGLFIPEDIPDSADAENLQDHPERFEFGYVLENFNGQKTRN